MVSNPSQSLIAPTGHVNLLSDVLILAPLRESKSLHNVPNVDKVSMVSAFISFAPIRIASKNGNLIGLRFNSSDLNVTQRIQLSFGHVPFTIIFFFPLMNAISISFPISSFRTLLIFHTSTVSLLIDMMLSSICNPMLCPSISVDMFSILAGVEINSPLMNHCSLRNFTVGIR